MKTAIVQIDGGIGRVICSVPAIEKMSKKRRVIVVTSHPEVFWHNPNIYKVYNLNREYLWDDVIKHGEFFYPEPYFNHQYYTQKQHMIQSFDMLLNNEGEGKFVLPKIYLSREEMLWAIDFINGRKKQFGKSIAMLQCYGSTCNIVENKHVDNTHRSLPKYVVDEICDRSNCLYINASHIPMDHMNVWQQKFTIRELFALTSFCDFIVSIDSYLSHTGAGFGKQGILFFGGTYPANLGYPNYKMVLRDDYPKNYFPNRFVGYVDENKGALDFTEDEIDQIITTINNRDFPDWQLSANDEGCRNVCVSKECTECKCEDTINSSENGLAESSCVG
jgi:hypothetical protein